MGWLKTELEPEWHAKVKAYRDETNCENMTEAVRTLIKRGIIDAESEHGVFDDG